ncbi:MAG: SAM-dependent chlorinase/fluorinase [Balneolales bacterium]
MPKKPSKRPIITLTSDFGYKDHYVSAMKAVILEVVPEVRFIDISHDIEPQDIMAGAWVIKNSAFLYPPGTIHLGVIDPGVGTSRKPIIVRIKDQVFVGPDNGLFSLAIEEGDYEVYELTNPEYRRKSLSNTFHGRDIFAPAAAHAASGVDLNKFGPPIDELTTYRWATPISDAEGIQGWVVHIDYFGNLITNIPVSIIRNLKNSRDFKIYVGNTIFKNIVRTFGEVADGEPAALIGSSDMLEIVINKGNAAEMLSVIKGAPVSIIYQK